MKEPECNYSNSKNEQRPSLLDTTSAPKSETDTSATGSEVSKLLGTNGYLRNTLSDLLQSNKDLELRMARTESRLVQLMLHLGLDPQEKRYG